MGAVRPRPGAEPVGFDDYVARATGRATSAGQRQWWSGFIAGAWTTALAFASLVALLWCVP
jgi:hypothetical protein